MKLAIKPGRYVVAVSGGVDSMVLLKLLVERRWRQAGSKYQLTVAHFDHGMRPDSGLDRQLVEQVAAEYGLPFAYAQADLGAGASEAAARQARYAFLRQIQQQVKAQAIITAHHQDDVIETAIINLLRGTGRRGLSSLQSRPDMLRPLLHLTKTNLIDYARIHHLTWHEDATNQDVRYLRNYVRQRLMVRLTPEQRQQWVALIDQALQLNQQIDAILETWLMDQTDKLDRRWFINLPHLVAREVMATWLRRQGVAGFTHQTIERLTIAAKALPVHKQIDAREHYVILVGNDHLELQRQTR